MMFIAKAKAWPPPQLTSLCNSKIDKQFGTSFDIPHLDRVIVYVKSHQFHLFVNTTFA